MENTPKPWRFIFIGLMILAGICLLAFDVWCFLNQHYREIFYTLIWIPGAIFRGFRQSFEPKRTNALMAILVIGLLLFVFNYDYSHDYAEYRAVRCNAHFGPQFNPRRLQIGAPVIPAGWRSFMNEPGFVDWYAKNDKSIGHTSKTIYVDSHCQADSEQDEYTLPDSDEVKRSVTIKTLYARGQTPPRVTYYLNKWDGDKLISRAKIDSIFQAEKIKKDY
jgi:hypothetical protein